MLFWIRSLVFSSVPPVLLILLPRNVKQSVSSNVPNTGRNLSNISYRGLDEEEE